jgi:serine/threonine protein kinase
MVGTWLNHYRLTKPLGSGGMGEVCLAEDTHLKRQVAIKILPASFAPDVDRRERFEREAQEVAALNHSNIVTVYSIEHASDTHFMTMEYVGGRPLTELTLPADQSRPYFTRGATSGDIWLLKFESSKP